MKYDLFIFAVLTSGLASCSTPKPAAAKKAPIPTKTMKPICVNGILFEPYEDIDGKTEMGWTPDMQGHPIRCKE